MEELYFIKDEHVVSQGEIGDAFFIIFDGTCEVEMD
jgi:hypothetical protein